MNRKVPVPFLGGLGAAMPPGYPTQVGTLARPGQKCYQRLTLCLIGGYGRVIDAAGMSEVGTGIRTRMKVRKQNESGNVPDSFCS